MKYTGMPAGMWLLFGRSFRKQLSDVLGYDHKTAGNIMKKAKRRLRLEIAALAVVFALLAGWFAVAVVHQARSSAAKDVVATEVATGALEDYLNEMSDEVNNTEAQ